MPATQHAGYQVRRVDQLGGSVVATHRGDFLVVTGKLPDLSTIIFQKHSKYSGVWVYRRTISGQVDPEAAVTGHLLSTWEEPDIVAELEKRLAGREKAYWQMINENMKLKAELRQRKRRAKKRG